MRDPNWRDYVRLFMKPVLGVEGDLLSPLVNPHSRGL